MNPGISMPSDQTRLRLLLLNLGLTGKAQRLRSLKE